MGRSLPLAIAATTLVAFKSAACGIRVGSSALTPSALPTVPVDSVRVFVTQSPAEYTEIALLVSEGHSLTQSEVKRVRALRERAARLGANGLLLLDVRSPAPADVSGVVVGGPGDGSVVAGQTYSGGAVWRAVAIRYAR